MTTETLSESVHFTMTSAMTVQYQKILDHTDLPGKTALFRAAFTLLEIHVEAAMRGQEMFRVDPDRPDCRDRIVLPFVVRKSDE